MSSPPRAEPGGTSDRQRCAYCGANNFPTSPTCWQCGRPLRPLSINAGAAAAAPGPSQTSAGTGAPAWPSALGQGAPMAHSALAPKAAAALGILFPWAGLPIGIAFLMLDDPRKEKLGWIAIGWSIAGTILNVLMFVLPLIGLLPYLKAMIPHLGGGALPGGNGGGIPSLGGDEQVLSLRVFLLFLF